MLKNLFVSCFTVFAIFSLFGYVFCAEWKDLHEQADKQTIKAARQAVDKNPGSVDDLYVLALVNLNNHKDSEAGEIFNKIMSIEPDSYAAKWGKAEVLRRRHKLVQAENILKEVIKEYPEFSPAYISMAYVDYINMNFVKSVKEADKVIRQGRDKVDLSNYVRAYLVAGGSRGMVAHYGGPISKIVTGTSVLPLIKKASSLQPDAPGVLFGLGSFYLLAPALAGGDIDKAIEYLEKAVKTDNLFADAYVRLAQAYKVKGDNNKYEIYINKALEIDPLNELAIDIKSGRCKFICVGKN